LMMRRFGISSHIVLHMMGGLAIPDSSGFGARSRDSRSSILISFAGPAAGFVFAGLIILVIIAIPSFKLLYYADRAEDAEMTIKAIGHQWYWSYEYPDHGDFTFDAVMLTDDELKEGQPRLLATDNMVVLPVDTRIRLLVTADDVLHNFALPAFGIKMDANPGKINETWVQITREGTYYGQCSEICGSGHSYMPISVKAVSKAAFEEWVAKAKQDYARAGAPETGPYLAQVPRLAQAPGAE